MSREACFPIHQPEFLLPRQIPPSACSFVFRHQCAKLLDRFIESFFELGRKFLDKLLVHALERFRQSICMFRIIPFYHLLLNLPRRASRRSMIINVDRPPNIFSSPRAICLSVFADSAILVQPFWQTPPGSRQKNLLEILADPLQLRR